MNNQLNIFARITPLPAHFVAARDAICAILDATRAEPGCIAFKLAEDNDRGMLYLYEEWRDETALAEHYEQPYTKAVFAAYDAWLAEPPDILHLRPVG